MKVKEQNNIDYETEEKKIKPLPFIDYKNWGTLRIFAAHYKNHKGLFILDLACATVASLIELAFPYVSRICMQEYLPEGKYQVFFMIMGIVILAYILRMFLYYIITFWGHRMGAYIEADMRGELVEHIETLSFSFFNKNRTGQLMSRVTTDLFDISELSHHGPENLFISALTLFGAFGILLSIEWRLACIVFAVVPLFVVFTIIMRGAMSRANMRVKIKLAEINSTIESGFSGIRTAKAFANEEEEIRKFRKSNLQHVGAKIEHHRSMAIFNCGMEFALSILSVIVIVAGGALILNGRLDYVNLVTFSLYVSTFITPIRNIVNLVEQYMSGMAGFQRFLEIMRTEPDIVDSPDAVELTNVVGNIDVEGIDFTYDDTDIATLKDVSFHVPAGTSFALVGPSGGGKTTISNLIPRFFDVDKGSIKIDGIDVRDMTQRSLRLAIGVVQQDVFMFAGTIYENIAYGKEGASYEDVVAAAVKAEIHDEIMQMPDGYDTYIGERGVMLSGGQKQRLGIARVFLKNPPILILDEATSALDSVTEARIQHAFDELAKDRTSIIIAHRLSTIRGASNIAVIEGGKVAETGNHEELVARGGEYSRLVKAQMI